MSNTKNEIFIKGATANNLKNISVHIPKNQLVVVTGVSGSGKSSLTMDTLYAEGQRRYVESLSAYARQFLMRMKKPEVEMISGICPAIAIEQKVTTSNNRSTVGSLTEILDYLRLLFGRVGKTYSPVSGQLVTKHEVSDVVDFLLKHQEKRAFLLIPLQQKYPDRLLKDELDLLLQRGFNRLQFNNAFIRTEDFQEQHLEVLAKTLGELEPEFLRIVVDRFRISDDQENLYRMSDSVSTALYESGGDIYVLVEDEAPQHFNSRFELDGIEFIEPVPQLFNHNNSFGACPSCEGYGKTIGIDMNKVIPNKSLSVYEGAVACWSGESYGQWQQQLLSTAHYFNFPVHKPYAELSKSEKRLLETGNQHFGGVLAFFDELASKSYKIQNRVMLSRYRGRTTCNVCQGSRLRKEALYVRIGEATLADLVEMPVDKLSVFFENLQLSETDAHIADRLLHEIKVRLDFMKDVGLGYLTLNRVSGTLSGGETQRINLIRTLGSNLTSSMYILDEPSIGLHPRDTGRLLLVLKSLRDLGNTVIVVEHEEEVIGNCDYLIDIGPGAGILGGEVVFAGPFREIYDKANDSLTALYMSGRKKIPTPLARRKVFKKIQLKGVSQHNLKNIDVSFPLECLVVVSGVSGSGKTTLVKKVLYPAVQHYFEERSSDKIGAFEHLSGDMKFLEGVEMVNQSPIGRSSRSNPVTYVKAYDAIRKLFSDQPLSKIRGYEPKHFSFNVDGGRCDACNGDGEQVVEMQFLADIKLECESCGGKRFKKEILEVKYQDKNIADVLSLTIDEAILFFEDIPEVIKKMKPLQDVGLGYVQLGQSSSTLSGGEAQRVKLASFLGKDNAPATLFIFDEPTTGLHFHDIQKLLIAFNSMVEKGHTILVVEHNMEVIKCADYVIDLGPEAGDEGGYLVFEGTPEALAEVETSYTGQFLKEKLSSRT